MKSLRLGTRKSLLATVQSRWVAREIERANPGLSVVLVGIETEGDRVLDRPLQEVEGKNFFVKELDQALLRGEVDLAVHSLKDLSLERPAELACAAIPIRENPRDVLIFAPGIEEKLSSGKPIRIGTSSPRREENLTPFLEKALPLLGEKSPSFKVESLRGNVPTRLSRLHEPASSGRALDGVVLALAGLNRLALDPESSSELKKLLRGTRKMVLPLTHFPSAPGQGALSVECLSSNTLVFEAIGKIHDPKTAEQVKDEREVLSRWGGGCHQRFGASRIEHRGFENGILWIRGKAQSGQTLQECRFFLRDSKAAAPIWDGSAFSGDFQEMNPEETSFSKGDLVFVAHARALPPGWEERLDDCRVWVSGMGSWRKLAERGVWIEGCSESLGFEAALPTMNAPIWENGKDQWALTHHSAAQAWKEEGLGVKTISTYQVRFDKKAPERLSQARTVFWASGEQFEAWSREAHPEALHCSGAGRTAERIRRSGARNARVFPSYADWKGWVKP